MSTTTGAGTVTTTGVGSVRAVPDSAVVQVELVFEARGVAEALAGVDSAVRLAGEVARRHTDAAKIASRQLNVWPRHDPEGRRTLGYEAHHGLAVGCSDIDAAGRLLAELAAEVGDRLRVEGISLEISEPGPLEDEAREAAYADARRKAEHLASFGDHTVGRLVAVVEGRSGGVRPMAAGYAMEASFSKAEIEPGESTLQATVTATWELD